MREALGMASPFRGQGELPVRAREGALGRVPAKQAERFPLIFRFKQAERFAPAFRFKQAERFPGEFVLHMCNIFCKSI